MLWRLLTSVGGMAAVWKLAHWWFEDPDQLSKERRKELREKKLEAIEALADNRFDDFQRLTTELRNLSVEP